MSQVRRASWAVVGLVTIAVGVGGFAACGGSAGGGPTTGDGGASSGCADPLGIPSSDPQDLSDAGVLAGSQPIYASAFDGYSSWQSYQYLTTRDAGPHEAGNLTAWINKVPPPGSTSFPTGTIIIKRIDSIPQTFAMEKRGDDVNQGGAEHWEFFELETGCDGKSVSYIWRGFGPPLAESYGGDPNACNSCHVGFKDNDFVGSVPLQLGNF